MHSVAAELREHPSFSVESYGSTDSGTNRNSQIFPFRVFLVLLPADSRSGNSGSTSKNEGVPATERTTSSIVERMSNFHFLGSDSHK